jgi:hypothetical protein
MAIGVDVRAEPDRLIVTSPILFEAAGKRYAPGHHEIMLA